MKPNYGTHSFLKNYIKYFRKLFKNNNLEVKDLHYLLQNNGIMPDKVEDEKTGKIMPMYKRAQLDALINGYTVGWDKVDIHKLKSDYSEYLRKLNAPPPKPKETKRWGKIEIPEYHPEYEEENVVPYKKPEYPKDDVINSDLDWNNENDMESISKQLEKQYQTENTKYKMKRKIVLTESDLHKVVKKSVKQILKEYNIQQIPYSNNMQTSMDNGFNGQNNQEVMQYIGDLPNYVGKVTKLCQQNNTNYPQVLNELQSKVIYYLNNGYFGQQQEVLETVKLFSELLSYLNGCYEAAVSRYTKLFNQNNTVTEGVFDDWKNKLMYKKQNSMGVQQHMNDKNQSPYAVQQYNGQWMTDLQQELQKFLQWGFLHGPKTTEATQLFIQFLNVEKRAFFGWFDNNMGKIMGNMRKCLLGVAILATTATAIAHLPLSFGDGADQNMNQPGIENVVQQQPQQQQSVNVSFAKNMNTLSQQDLATLQSLPPGSYKVIVHQLQNPSGQDASYEQQLVNARATAVQNAMPGSKISVERGENVQGPNAQVEIVKI